MVTAILLIRSNQGKTPELAQELLEIPEVSEVYSVAGPYDLVAMLRVKEYDQMAELVPARIVGLPGIENTTTLMAFQCYSRHDLDRLFSVGFEEPAAES
ncbi:MAG: Lrp/AsnC family transcriptional regulator [Chloroflexota bacterium]